MSGEHGPAASHEGSSYASQKVLQMAWHRPEHARSRVAELDRSVLAMSTQRNFAEHRRIGRLAENSLH